MNLMIHGTPVSLRRPKPTVDDINAYDALPLGISLGESARADFVRVFVLYGMPGYPSRGVCQVPIADLTLDVPAATELRDSLTGGLNEPDRDDGPEPDDFGNAWEAAPSTGLARPKAPADPRRR